MDFVEYVGNIAHQCGWRLSNVYSPNLVGIGFDIGDYRTTAYVKGFAQNQQEELTMTIHSDISPSMLDNEDLRVGAYGIMEMLMERNNKLDFGGYWSLIEYEENKKGFVAQIPLLVDNINIEVFQSAVGGVITERVWLLGTLSPELNRQFKEGLENS